MNKNKKTKIGFDLDGVFIDKPPLISKELLEWLVRDHKTKELSFRYPKPRLERLIRYLSHHPFFRPPIKENIQFLKKLAKNKNCELYLITSRYKFLEGRTKQWLRKHKIDNIFVEIFINKENRQPHKFKIEKIKELNLNIYTEDDLPIATYLNHKLNPKTKIILISKKYIIPERLIDLEKSKSLKIISNYI